MPWSVIQTQVNAATKAVTNLRLQGFNYYNPIYSERIIRRGGASWRRVQLFKDYVFVEIVDQWRALLSTRGVCRVIMDRNKPARLSDEVIIQLRSREDDNGLVRLSKERFHLGQCVFVQGGAFKDHLAIYDGQSKLDRGYVLLALLGKTTRMEVHEANLRAA